MAGDCDSIGFLMTLVRGGVLIIAALAGVMCIYLGWRLYKDAVLSKTEGSASFRQGRFKLAAAGPGVFFALFGMWLLVKLVDRPIQINASTQAPASFAPRSPDGHALAFRDDPINAAGASPLLMVAETTVPSTQAAGGANNDCLVQRKFVGVMFDGSGSSITSEQADESLQVAIGALRRLPPGTADIDTQKLPAVIQTLRAMRNNIVDK